MLLSRKEVVESYLKTVENSIDRLKGDIEQCEKEKQLYEKELIDLNTPTYTVKRVKVTDLEVGDSIHFKEFIKIVSMTKNYCPNTLRVYCDNDETYFYNTDNVILVLVENK